MASNWTDAVEFCEMMLQRTIIQPALNIEKIKQFKVDGSLYRVTTLVRTDQGRESKEVLLIDSKKVAVRSHEPNRGIIIARTPV